MEYSIVEKFLRSRIFILSVAIFSVLWLTPNTYWVYYSMMKDYQPIWREIVSGGISLIVASGILIYTMRGNLKIANYYMWFEISVSSFYYIITIGWSWWLIPAFSFVFMLPVSLKHYTSELNKDEDKAKKPTFYPKESEVLTNEVVRLQNKTIEQEMVNVSLENKIKEYAAKFVELQTNDDSFLHQHKDEISLLKKDLNILNDIITDLREENTELTEQNNLLASVTKVSDDELKNKTVNQLSESELISMAKNNSDLPAELFS